MNTLALFFTRGVSLQAWHEAGNLAREVAIYRQLAQRGWKVLFVTYGHDDGPMAAELGGIDVVWNRWRLPEWAYAATLPWIAPSLRKALIKSNQTDGADIALSVANRLGRPFVARCGYMLSFVMEERHGLESAQAVRARDLERRVFGGSRLGIVTTAEMQDRLVSRLGMAEDKIAVVPNYVDLDLFRPMPDIVRSRRRILYVGRFHPEKNPLGLIQACAGLDVELVLVGQGHQQGELENVAKAAGVDARFVGPVANRALPAMINEAALFVAPSLYEGHPKATIEAMACGAPVLGTDVPGIRSVIRHGDTGWLCELDVAAMHASLKDLLADPERCRTMGANARRYAVDHFSLDAIAQRENALLTSVVQH